MYNMRIIFRPMRHLSMLRIIVMLGCLFSVITVHAGNVSQTCQERHCVAIVDAGSTGSRLHIYAYDLDEKKAPIQIEQLWSKKIKPGLATIEPKQENIEAYVDELFAQAPEQNLPVYFYATGGMRLVSKPKQALYYQLIQQWFTMHPQWTLIDAKTITGQFEGALGWLAVNYNLGSLQDTDKPLVSVMDMGGASVQIALPVLHSNEISERDLMQMNIYGRHIELFVHSFLGLGQTEVSHQYFNSAPCFSNDYPLPNETRGQGDAITCQRDISYLINQVHQVNSLIAPVIAANPVSSWYAMSGLSTLVKNKLFNFSDNQFTNQALLQQADSELCQPSWNTLSNLYPDNDYTYINCLTSSYYYGLMVNGYGISPEQDIHYLPGDDEPDWTVGAVLYQTHA